MSIKYLVFMNLPAHHLTCLLFSTKTVYFLCVLLLEKMSAEENQITILSLFDLTNPSVLACLRNTVINKTVGNNVQCFVLEQNQEVYIQRGFFVKSHHYASFM